MRDGLEAAELAERGGEGAGKRVKRQGDIIWLGMPAREEHEGPHKSQPCEGRPSTMSEALRELEIEY